MRVIEKTASCFWMISGHYSRAIPPEEKHKVSDIWLRHGPVSDEHLAYRTFMREVRDQALDVQPGKNQTRFEEIIKSYWEGWWQTEIPAPQIIMTSNDPMVDAWWKSRCEKPVGRQYVKIRLDIAFQAAVSNPVDRHQQSFLRRWGFHLVGSRHVDGVQAVLIAQAPHESDTIPPPFAVGQRKVEVMRAGIQSIPMGQTHAGLAMGLTMTQVYRHVLLPVSYRIIIPPLTSDFMGVCKIRRSP